MLNNILLITKIYIEKRLFKYILSATVLMVTKIFYKLGTVLMQKSYTGRCIIYHNMLPLDTSHMSLHLIQPGDFSKMCATLSIEVQDLDPVSSKLLRITN